MNPMPLSPTIHEETILKYHVRDPMSRMVIPDAGIGALADGLRKARELGTRMISTHAAIMNDPTAPELTRAKRAMQAVRKMRNEVDTALENARANYEAELARLRQSMAPPPARDQAERELHREIRSRFLTLTEKERRDAMDNARATLNMTFVSAIYGADTFLTGLTPVERDARLASWQMRVHPDECKRQQRLQKAREAFDRALKLFEIEAESLLRLPSAVVNRDEEAATRAREAMEAAGIAAE